VTSPVTGSTASSSPSDTAALGKTAALLGKDQFLQLLVTQLKNQDPMSPMDGTQFAAQLAQFSTVEQLMQMNTKLDAQTTAAAQAQISQQASFANSLIGRDVILNGAKMTVADDGSSRINVDLAASAATVHVDVIGGDGKTVVATQDITGIAAGSQTIPLALGKVPAGNYTYKVTAADSTGKSIKVSGNTVGQVQATVFSGGQVMVRVDGSIVPVTDITEIIAAATPAASPKTN